MSSPAAQPPRRRVLYIRHQRRVKLSDTFRLNQDEWVEAMSALADVTLMNSDFDLDEVCDRVQPDFILYESPGIHPHPLNIANPKAHPEIPRIAFQMQDPHSGTRINFLRQMEALDIKWLFSHMTEAALRQSPELKLITFSVSHFIDDKVFHDYGLQKDIPVSIFGGFMAPEIYAWREQTGRAITDHFPTLIYTHPGYLQPTPRHKFMVVGESYARVLNRSHFSLADTTRLDCLVRKHLEIPAAGSVLVAPDTPVLKPYGFIDMENCILGSGQELFDKMAAVADDPALYEKIRKNGYDLVHSKYTSRNWRGILDFYECLRTLKSGETIRQQGVMGPFVAVPDNKQTLPAIVGEDYPDSIITSLLKDWMQSVINNEDYDEIADKLSKMSSWFFHMTEQWVPLGIIALLKSDIAHATEFLIAAQALRRKLTGFTEYDPEEIAWLSLTGALSGNGALLNMTRELSSTMRHLSLRRVQWLGKVLATGGDVSNSPDDVVRRLPDDQISTHWTGQLELKTWLTLVDRVLAANGQSGLLKGLS